MTTFQPPKAIYLQIVDRICASILQGDWPIGSKIISIREYATLAEVNPNTVFRSYEYLKNAGIILEKRGIGFFVSPEAVKLIEQQYRKKFLNVELPLFLQSAHLLGFTPEDLATYYTHYLNTLSK